jgi:hypothetical protein
MDLGFLFPLARRLLCAQCRVSRLCLLLRSEAKRINMQMSAETVSRRFNQVHPIISVFPSTESHSDLVNKIQKHRRHRNRSRFWSVDAADMLNEPRTPTYYKTPPD